MRKHELGFMRIVWILRDCCGLLGWGQLQNIWKKIITGLWKIGYEIKLGRVYKLWRVDWLM